MEPKAKINMEPDVMDCFVGIDLGSTTTKAIFLDKDARILGKGITNSRSNYSVACQVAKEEAEISSRFFLLSETLKGAFTQQQIVEELMEWLSAKFLLAQYKKQLSALKRECLFVLDSWSKHVEEKEKFNHALEKIFFKLEAESTELFQPKQKAKSDFFRDIASSLFLRQAELISKEQTLSFDRMVGIFDKAILRVENQSFAKYFIEYLDFAGNEVSKLPKFKKYEKEILSAIKNAALLNFNIIHTVGTGYGRLTLPFPKEQIRSEILCHGLGAHYLFPKTRTVLDIGGQDTKAIQIDFQGVVTRFQMNDRCAAGCGRYLGYIADEMNMGVHQLGPLAQLSTKPVKINSTCTVFAGAELRERLSLGEKREDILAGLHRAIILRAMSLLARSGGVFSEFTFTGGVARNEAATGALAKLINENYGNITMNISSESIYMGALGAALFAKKDNG